MRPSDWTAYCRQLVPSQTAQPSLIVKAPTRLDSSLSKAFQASAERGFLRFSSELLLADDRCNLKTCDRFPAGEHLEAWTERNTSYGGQIGKAGGVGYDLGIGCVQPRRTLGILPDRSGKWAHLVERG